MPMKPLARLRLNGTVTIRGFHPPHHETTAAIRKGDLVEPLADIARRVSLSPSPPPVPPSSEANTDAYGDGSGDLLIVDAQELAQMGRLCDQGTYYLTGGRPIEPATGSGNGIAISPSRMGEDVSHTSGDGGDSSTTANTAQRLPPDIAVAWAYDARVLLHAPLDGRTPEAPYRLERALAALLGCPRASELLPRELLEHHRRQPSLHSFGHGDEGKPQESEKDSAAATPTNRASFVPPRLATRAEVLSFQDEGVYAAFIDTGAALTGLASDVYCNEQTSSTAVRLSVAAVTDAGRQVLAAAAAARASLKRPSADDRHSGDHCPGDGASGDDNEHAPAASATTNTASSQGEPLIAFCLVRPPGHHCTASRPAGFCLANNVAIAAQQLLEQQGTAFTRAPQQEEEEEEMRKRKRRSSSCVSSQPPRIAIMDLDVHFGEGTASFVDGWSGGKGSNNRGTVSCDDFPLLYLSLHRYDAGAFYPFDKRGDNTYTGEAHPGCIANVAVDTRAHIPTSCHEVISDHLMTEVMERVFIPRLDAFQPDVVFVSLGFDAGYGDPLGRMAVEGGFAAAVSRLKAWCLQVDTHCEGVGERGNGSRNRYSSGLTSHAVDVSNRSNGISSSGSRRAGPAGLVVVLEGGYQPETVAQGVLGVAHALSLPAADADVMSYAAPRVPRLWADVRTRQERRQREWARLQADRNSSHGEGEQCSTDANTHRPTMVTDDDGGGGGGGRERGHADACPASVATDDELMVRHRQWCEKVVNDAIAAHCGAMPPS